MRKFGASVNRLSPSVCPASDVRANRACSSSGMPKFGAWFSTSRTFCFVYPPIPRSFPAMSDREYPAGAPGERTACLPSAHGRPYQAGAAKPVSAQASMVRRGGRIGSAASGEVDQSGVGRHEPAGVEIERAQVILEVDVQPLAACGAHLLG